MKKWYKLVFKQLQPIHIGAGNYGVINETRIFIPGWTMWGALTKTYNLQSKKDLSENQELFEDISCFYPSFDKEGNDVLFPNFKKGEFYLGEEYSEKKFRAKFVDTYVSTAIMPNSRMAKDESLHEIDVILLGAKTDFIEKEVEKQLYWVGILKIDEDTKNNFLIENLKITIGGDARYGLGKLKLLSSEDEADLNQWGISDKGEIKIIDKSAVKNYVPLKEIKQFEGKTELLAEFDFRKALPKATNPKLYIIPGSNKVVPERALNLKKGGGNHA
jgi:hypothetical protein